MIETNFEQTKIYMKQILLTISMFFLLANFGIAQDIMNEGHLRLEITEVGAEDEQMAGMLQMMKGSYSDFYFDKNNSLASMNMMGGMMEITTLTKTKSGEVTMLFNAMGTKNYVESTEDEREKMNEGSLPEITVDYDESDTKEILGYKTKKANISIKGQADMKMTAYVAPEIKLSNKVVQGLESIKLDGFPLAYEINVNGIRLVMTATELDKKVDSGVFNINTEGYTKTTLEELTKSLGGMAGGMGF